MEQLKCYHLRSHDVWDSNPFGDYQATAAPRSPNAGKQNIYLLQTAPSTTRPGSVLNARCARRRICKTFMCPAARGLTTGRRPSVSCSTWLFSEADLARVDMNKAFLQSHCCHELRRRDDLNAGAASFLDDLCQVGDGCIGEALHNCDGLS